MRISTTHIISHDLYFDHTDQWIEQVIFRTGMPVFTEMYYSDSSRPNLLAPPEFNGWIMRSRDDLPLQEIFTRGEPLTMQAKNTWLDGLTANINPYAINVSHAEFYMGQWTSLKYLADWLYKNGLPGYKHYQHKTEDVYWMLNNRMNLFEFSKMFQQGGLTLISFCDDLHAEWLQHFIKDKWSAGDFKNWAAKKMTTVKFTELSDFKFPDQAPAMYNVLIEDDFSDLEHDDHEWARPHYQVAFTANTLSLPENAGLAPELKMLALNFPMELTVNTSENAVSGIIKWPRQIYSQYFAEHFITNFFTEKGVDVIVTEV